MRDLGEAPLLMQGRCFRHHLSNVNVTEAMPKRDLSISFVIQKYPIAWGGSRWAPLPPLGWPLRSIVPNRLERARSFGSA